MMCGAPRNEMSVVGLGLGGLRDRSGTEGRMSHNSSTICNKAIHVLAKSVNPPVNNGFQRSGMHIVWSMPLTVHPGLSSQRLDQHG